MKTVDQTQVSFLCEAIPESLGLLRVEGTEAISSPSTFEITLTSPDPNLDLNSAVGREDRLTIRDGSTVTSRAGVIAEVEQGELLEGGRFGYRLRLVSKLKQLDLTRRSRFFQGMTVPEVLEQGLAKLGLEVDFRLNRDYLKRETITQYEETDLCFLSRLMEHEGISYFLADDGEIQRLIVTDDTATQAESRGEALPFILNEREAVPGVRALTSRRRQLPRRVVLSDYHDQTPHVPLQGEAEVDRAGLGVVSESNAGFATPSEGMTLAAIRAEELRCRQTIIEGRGEGIFPSPGDVTRIEGHPRRDLGGPLLVVSVDHRIDRNDSGWTHRTAFTALPTATPFRPERRTPKPRVLGALSAQAVGRGERADMDGQGRYRVRLPFDAVGGEPSGYLRMAQPWAGADQGMHFPLDAGAEVLWSCLNGDPDRPVITGAVPTPLNPSLAAGEARGRSVIKGRGGVTMEFGAVPAPSPEPHYNIDFSQAGSSEMQPALEQRHQGFPLDIAFANYGTPDPHASTRKFFKIKVPGYTGNSVGTGATDTQWADMPTNISYLRIGARDSSELPEHYYEGLEKATPFEGERQCDDASGFFSYTDGNHVEVIGGDRNIIIRGKQRIAIGGGTGIWDAAKCYYSDMRLVGGDLWRTTTADYTASDTYKIGDAEDFFLGFTFSGKLALEASIFLGGKLDLSAAVMASAEAALKTSYSASLSWSQSDEASVNTSPTPESSGSVSNKINVKPVETGGDEWKAALAVGAVVGVGVGLGVGLGTGIDGEEGGDAGSAAGAGIGIGATAGILTGLSAMTLLKYKNQKVLDAKTEIALTTDSIMIGMGKTHIPGICIEDAAITISCKDSSIIINETGIILSSNKEMKIESLENCKVTSKKTAEMIGDDYSLLKSGTAFLGVSKKEDNTAGIEAKNIAIEAQAEVSVSGTKVGFD